MVPVEILVETSPHHVLGGFECVFFSNFSRVHFFHFFSGVWQGKMWWSNLSLNTTRKHDENMDRSWEEFSNHLWLRFWIYVSNSFKNLVTCGRLTQFHITHGKLDPGSYGSLISACSDASQWQQALKLLDICSWNIIGEKGWTWGCKLIFHGIL